MDSVNGIPVLDCSELKDSVNLEKVAELFGDALKQNGVAYVINTGVKSETIKELEDKCMEFCSLPVEVKQKYPQKIEKDSFWGWKGPTDSEITKSDIVETLTYTAGPKYLDDNAFPSEVHGLRKVVCSFKDSVSLLNEKFFLILGMYLKLQDPKYFFKTHSDLNGNQNPSFSSVRFLMYPPPKKISEQRTKLRLPEHQDLNTLTYLHQKNGSGLEVQLVSSGEWVSVPHIPNTFVVMVGKALELWSGGLLPAPFHRVSWSDESDAVTRLTVGLFVAPNSGLESQILNHEELVSLDGLNTAKSRVTVGDYIQEKTEKDFAVSKE